MPLDWEEVISEFKQAMKEAMYEVYEELEAQDDELGKHRDVTIFKLPCKYCSKPITSGQSFVLFHSECVDKEQLLR